MTTTTAPFAYETAINLWSREDREAIRDDVVAYMQREHIGPSRTLGEVQQNVDYALLFEARGGGLSDSYAISEFNPFRTFRQAVMAGDYEVQARREPVGPPVVAIGPEHPGWVAWWDELWENGGDDNRDEYNALARAMGGPVREESARDYYVTVEIPSFTVTVALSATESEASSDHFTDLLDQVTIDNAIRDHINNEDVSWEVYDYEAQ